MNKLIDWRRALWSRRARAGIALSAPGGTSVLSREQVRELDLPTYLRRRIDIAGLSGPPAGVRVPTGA